LGKKKIPLSFFEDKMIKGDQATRVVVFNNGKYWTCFLSRITSVKFTSSFGHRQPWDQILEPSTKCMENLEHSCKSKNPSHRNLIGYEKILFGSWGINEEIHGEENLSDFLPNLLGLKN
jgi:hypothetical protein